MLSLDGGGFRPAMQLNILQHMEALTGLPIHKLFDVIVGTGPGAMIALGIGGMKQDTHR